MQYPMWASNSADDPTFDALIEQAELDELWAATAPDEPAAHGEGSISAWRRGVDTDWDWVPDEPPEASQR